MTVHVESIGIAPSQLNPTKAGEKVPWSVIHYQRLGFPWAPVTPRPEPFWVVAFSNGVVRFRDWAMQNPGELHRVKGVVLLDGTHAPAADAGAQVVAQAYRKILSLPGNHTVTSSRIVPPGYKSTRETVRLIGLPDKDGVHNVHMGGGAIRVVNTAGADAAEHVKHGAMARPELLRIMSGLVPQDPVIGGGTGGGGAQGGGNGTPGAAAQAKTSWLFLPALALAGWAAYKYKDKLL